VRCLEEAALRTLGTARARFVLIFELSFIVSSFGDAADGGNGCTDNRQPRDHFEDLAASWCAGMLFHLTDSRMISG